MTLVKTVKKTLFRTMVKGVKTIAIGAKDRSNSKCSKDGWGFIANEQSEGSVDRKSLRGDIQGRGFLLN